MSKIFGAILQAKARRLLAEGHADLMDDRLRPTLRERADRRCEYIAEKNWGLANFRCWCADCRGDNFSAAGKSIARECELTQAGSLCYIALFSVERILEYLREPSVRGPVATRDGVK